MKKTTTLWLWTAFVLCICTTILNAFSGRWLTVAVAIISLAGLASLLFQHKKRGFQVVCVCAVFSFLIGAVSSILNGMSAPLAIGMSLFGAALVPVITGLVLRSEWNILR
ncbi:MAG: hypothetical protein U0L91_01935 [Gemmiger sp.]|uniref:hypothetical protein n=1 Tax=Gemmiger sp. TaxID=2049027 RepID=UPI002E772850|nr:hypothetical protein [Gemmiger sp.]MEE0800021.1 hypothetical protein [Gemmiger sp.]